MIEDFTFEHGHVIRAGVFDVDVNVQADGSEECGHLMAPMSRPHHETREDISKTAFDRSS